MKTKPRFNFCPRTYIIMIVVYYTLVHVILDTGVANFFLHLCDFNHQNLLLWCENDMTNFLCTSYDQRPSNDILTCRHTKTKYFSNFFLKQHILPISSKVTYFYV
uniref:Uncharacterized protein n=1 Tax=Cacopsylla melanoneura TaxID=428564 RepID=A0A8D8T3N1_9HEMI